MKVAVDLGAMCSEAHFGTYTFSENLVNALLKFKSENNYFGYSFCSLKEKLHYLRLPKKFFRFWGVFEDVLLALNQQPPLFTRGKIISFCHGLSYRFFPEFYEKSDVIRLEKQLLEMMKRSDKIIVSSVKVKEEFVAMNQLSASKIVVLPFGIPQDMEDKFQTIKSIKSKAKQKYFLFVGMEHNIKNIEFIKRAFSKFKEENKYQNYDLKIISDNISRENLKKLYQQATGLLTASYYESFNFPVLEALINDCPVVGLESAIIPEMKEFVKICDNNIEDFVLKMKDVSSKKQEINKNKLIDIFSWENYVRKLEKLY